MINEPWIHDIETPSIIVDMKKLKSNIKNMQEVADKCNCNLRPHIKTHKNIEIAKMQIEAGAHGITCAKISEAEVMALGGLNDIFVAYPLVGENRIRRAVNLNKKINRLILAADSLEGAQRLSQAAVNEGTSFEIRLEADTGLKRTGATRADIIKLALEVNALPGIRLTGIYTFKSMVESGRPTTDRTAAGTEEGRLISEIATEIRAQGIPIKDISAGSTPTAAAVAETGLINEIRPGTYVFYDYMTYAEGACTKDFIAAHIYATVVSIPSRDHAVIDGGTKTFPTDAPINAAPYYYPGYAIIEGYDNLSLSRMNEEHGIITMVDSNKPSALSAQSEQSGLSCLHVGQILKLTPIHICPAINLQNQVYVVDNGVLRSIKIDARGMLV